MKRTGYFLTAFAVLLLLTVSHGWSQVWIRAVDVPCFVTDRQGQLVNDLGKDDFTAYDNDKPVKITNFRKRLESPLQIALVLDRSLSVAEKFPLLQQASVKFLRSIMRKGEDRVCLIAFDSHVYLLQDWTDDVDQLSDMIGRLTATGGTALLDGLYKTCRDKFPPDPDNVKTRVIILVTDGEDTTSRATLKEAIDVVQRSGVTIYVVGVRAEDSLNARELQGKQVLSELKDITGGEVFYPKANQDGLEPLFDRIEHELRNQYIIGFTNYDTPDSTFHKVRIESTRKDLVVRTRKKGYYATR
jgi:Ca-activated chloride channel family protein